MNKATKHADDAHAIASLIREAMSTLKSSALAKIKHVSENDLRLDAEVLLAFCLGKPRTYLHAWPEHRVSKEIFEQFHNLIQKRGDKYPLAYQVGEQEFWSLPFKVTPDVLIPRPETECLVEFILSDFSNTHTPFTSSIKGLDLGTGSGAIALSLAHEEPQWQIEASDLSDKALAIAQHNKQTLCISSVIFKQSHWLNDIESDDFDFIVSNPPYLEEQAQELRSESIQFEPRSALCAGDLGLDDIKEICLTAPKHLKPKGLLIIEHGAEQGLAVLEIFKQQGFTGVTCQQDYAGLDRFTLGYKP